MEMALEAKEINKCTDDSFHVHLAETFGETLEEHMKSWVMDLAGSVVPISGSAHGELVNWDLVRQLTGAAA